MISDVGDIRLERDGLNLIISNVPEKWHGKMKFGKNLLSLIELILATGVIASVLLGFVLSLPILSSVLSVLLLIEVGREQTEFKHTFSVTVPAKTCGPDGKIVWDYDGSISYKMEYLDDGGEVIDPDNEKVIANSNRAKLTVSEGVASILSDDGELGLELPYGVRELEIEKKCVEDMWDENLQDEDVQEDKNKELVEDDITKEEAGELLDEITEQVEENKIPEVLNDEEGGIELTIPPENILTEGKVYHESSENDRRSIQLDNDGENVICTIRIDDFSSSAKIPIRNIEPAGRYVVPVTWGPERADFSIIPEKDIPNRS